MTELVFNLPNISIGVNWTINYLNASGSEFAGSQGTKGSGTKDSSVLITGLPEGEVVRRAVLTADISYTGDLNYRDYNSIRVNSFSFNSGQKNIDPSTIISGQQWTATFSYTCGCNNPGNFRVSPPPGERSYASTVYIKNIKLTVITDSNSFVGYVEDLPEGSKLAVNEPDGVIGIYSLVRHNYNPNLCLFWRDTALSGNHVYNHHSNQYRYKYTDEDGEEHLSYGQIDKYLIETFYPNLPEETKKYIKEANYPTRMDNYNNGDMYRYVCIPSLRELIDTSGYAEWNQDANGFGIVYDYRETLAGAGVYWTRSRASTANYAYRINNSGTSYEYACTYSGPIRPCFCVLEKQIVMPGDIEGTYILTSPIQEPTALKLNNAPVDLIDLQRDTLMTLSWDAVDDSRVVGYEVWQADSLNSDNFYCVGMVSADANGNIPTSLEVISSNKGYTNTVFKVRALAAPEYFYLSSELSDDKRVASTLKSNVQYFNGFNWKIIVPKYYNGNAWVPVQKVNQFNGSSWVKPTE